MDSQDYPIRHFQRMTELAEILKALPAQVLEHKYSHEAFGSWFLLLQYKRTTFQITFEGRDREYTLRKSLSRKHPHKWSEHIWRKAKRADVEPSLMEFVTAVEEAESAS